MATLYVVREGKVRGEGAYWGFGCFDHGTAKSDTLRLTRVGAMLLASKYGGRIVRIVTLSEQLRRAKKRIAELEKAAPEALEAISAMLTERDEWARQRGLTYDAVRDCVVAHHKNRTTFGKLVEQVRDLAKAAASKEYKNGRADERKAVVAHFRRCNWISPAETIASGEHVKGDDRG